MGSARDQIVPRAKIESLIGQGAAIVIFQDFVLRLDSWIEKHPGGRLVILHMVGRDATDEIMAYHTNATLKTVGAYRMGRKPLGPWINMRPPIRGGVYPQLKGSSIDDEQVISASDRLERAVKPDQAVFASDVSDASADDDTISVLRPGKARKHWTPAWDRPKSSAPAVDDASEGSNPAGCLKGDSSVTQQGRMCPIAYTSKTLQHNVDQDFRNYPSVDPETQQKIAARYRQLHQQIRDENLYECRYGEYGKEMIRYTCLFLLFLTTLRYGWYITSAVFLGLFWHQIMFTAHDAGHRAITQNFVADTIIGMFIADFCCGLSIGWWKSSHNVHHLVTNHPDHDPDIQNVPLFATCPSFFSSIHSTYYDFKFAWDAVATFMVPYQKYTYYPVMGIARFNLYLLSWLHVLSAKSSSLGNSKAWWIRPMEISFMAGYWFLFGYCLLWRTLPTWTIRVVFVLVSHIITMPLHVQITLSHWGMSTADLGETESFAQQQLRTTMDVDCPAWLDFIHGGLQFQAVHHLFPRVPRHNLRRVRDLTKQFTEDTQIPYLVLDFIDGNRKVMNRLEEVAAQAGILFSCQKYMAATGESGLY